MAKASYYELLQHPEWQKKRLEVMQQAGWACEHCEATDKQLSVHHTYYEKGKKPWEYPTQSLRCLCDDCHRAAQDLKDKLNRQLGKISALADLERLYGYACALEMWDFPEVPIEVMSAEMAQGIGECWSVRGEDVVAALRERSIDGETLMAIRVRQTGK